MCHQQMPPTSSHTHTVRHAGMQTNAAARKDPADIREKRLETLIQHAGGQIEDSVSRRVIQAAKPRALQPVTDWRLSSDHERGFDSAQISRSGAHTRVITAVHLVCEAEIESALKTACLLSRALSTLIKGARSHTAWISEVSS